MGWSQIPAEIFDIIVEDLPLYDIKNMRLVDKVGAANCLGHRMLSYASTAQTDLTERSLWDLVARSSHAVFGPAVRQLNIFAVCLDEVPSRIKIPSSMPFRSNRPTMSTEGLDIKLVREYQRTRDSLSDELIIDLLALALDSFTGLNSIVLDPVSVSSLYQKWWPWGVFAAGTSPWISHVCYLALAATSRSGTRARHLDLYTTKGTEPYLRYKHQSPSNDVYGMLCDDLASHLASIKQRHGDIRLPFETLHITLCTGPRTIHWPLHDWSKALSSRKVPESSKSDAAIEEGSSGLVQFLKCAPHLQNLYVYFNHKGSTIREEYFNIFNGMAELSFAHLRRLSLSDLPVTSAAILQFLHTHRNISHLDLQRVHILDDEEWDPIFRFISDEMMDLLVLILSDCYRGKSLVPLDRDQFFKKYFPTRRLIPVDFDGNNFGADIHTYFIMSRRLPTGIE